MCIGRRGKKQTKNKSEQRKFIDDFSVYSLLHFFFFFHKIYVNHEIVSNAALCWKKKSRKQWNITYNVAFPRTFENIVSSEHRVELQARFIIAQQGTAIVILKYWTIYLNHLNKSVYVILYKNRPLRSSTVYLCCTFILNAHCTHHSSCTIQTYFCNVPETSFTGHE